MCRKKIYILGFLVIGFLSSMVFGQANDHDCNSKLTKVFTHKIVKNGKTLYVLNKNYLMEPYFDEKCHLLQIDVSDSARWNNSDKDSDQEKDLFLTRKNYIEVIAQIDKASPLGDILDSDKIGLSSPRGTISWGKRQNAYIQITSTNTEKGNRIVSLTVYFVHEVSGILGGKHLLNQPGFIKKARLEIDDKLYWSDEQTFLSGNLNKPGNFKVFGIAQ